MSQVFSVTPTALALEEVLLSNLIKGYRLSSHHQCPPPPTASGSLQGLLDVVSLTVVGLGIGTWASQDSALRPCPKVELTSSLPT